MLCDKQVTLTESWAAVGALLLHRLLANNCRGFVCCPFLAAWSKDLEGDTGANQLDSTTMQRVFVEPNAYGRLAALPCGASLSSIWRM